MEFIDLQAFVQIATLGNLTRAGERIGVSKSIVSRRLAKLEKELGARLLTRTTRGVSLTETGGVFLESARNLLARADEARAMVAGRDGELAGQLRLAAPLSFGIEHLAPVLADFAARHPRLSIDVCYADHLNDIVSEGFDAALRIGPPGSPTLLVRRVASMRAVLAASPDYIARRGRPATPQELAGHEALIYTGSRDPGLWLFDARPRPVGVRVTGRIRANNGEALRAAALAGLGIGLFPEFMIHRALRDASLVSVLDDWPLPSTSMNLVRAPGSANAKIEALARFLLDHFAGPQPWDEPRGVPPNAT